MSQPVRRDEDVELNSSLMRPMTAAQWQQFKEADDNYPWNDRPPAKSEHGSFSLDFLGITCGFTHNASKPQIIVTGLLEVDNHKNNMIPIENADELWLTMASGTPKNKKAEVTEFITGWVKYRKWLTLSLRASALQCALTPFKIDVEDVLLLSQVLSEAGYAATSCATLRAGSMLHPKLLSVFLKKHDSSSVSHSRTERKSRKNRKAG